MRSSIRATSLAIAVTLALAAAGASAQERTASLQGQLTDAAGTPVAGAQVTLTNAATGRILTATTDASGRYRFLGLQAGGPYQVTSATGAQRSNLQLVLGDANWANLGKETATDLDGVVVHGVAPSNTTTTLLRDQILTAPASDGTITNLVRLNPHAQVVNRATNEISILGQNPRYNTIRLDGLDVGDTFGLEASNQPSPRQPFLLDAIESLSVTAVDYSAASPGAVGGVINAVTRSGTNEFHGSVFGTYRDADMVRANTDGSDYTGFKKEHSLGLTFGGPIIKDRLFFFLDAEQYRLNAPGPAFGPTGSGATNVVPVSQADIDAVRAIAKTKWGFDPGTIGAAGDAETTARSAGLKLDWYINDDHRLSYRHASTRQEQANFPGFASNSLAFSSYGYQKHFDLDSDSLHLVSRWNESLTTEASASYRHYVTEREPNSRLPAMAVMVNPAAILFMGTEENSYLNRLETKTWNAAFGAHLDLGAHLVNAGLDWSRNDINNLYARRINGTYGFFGLAYFQAGIATPFRFSYPLNGDANNMAADWTLENTGFYLEDVWQATERLTLTAGLRYDRNRVADAPLHNAAAQAAFGYDNRHTLDGNGLLQPRVSFRFQASPTLSIEGGAGLFRGQSPEVWLSNPYSNTGLNYIDYNFPMFQGVTIDPDNQIAIVPGNAPGATQSIDLISPDLEQPSIWKANLAVQQDLPWWGATARAELVVSRVHQAINYQNLNLGAATATGQDGRLLYWNAAGLAAANWNAAGSPKSSVRAKALANPLFSDVMLASKTERGGSEQLSFVVDKPFAGSDWSWMLGYTFTRARDASPLASANSASLWGGRTSFNPNEDVSARSLYEIKDRFIGSLNWKHAFFGANETHVTLFYEGRSGRPYSYVFDNDANGDGVAGNDLLYVPTGPGDVVFGSAAEEAGFFAMLNADEYLQQHRGSVVSRNGARAHWVNQFDVRIAQQLPAFGDGHRAELWLDILNVGNLLNRDWGKIGDQQYPANLGVVEFGGVCGNVAATPCTATDAGKYVYRFNTPDARTVHDVQAASRWAIQVGFRYAF